MRISDEENMNAKKHMDYLSYAAKNEYGLVSHGFIYKVMKGFYATSTSGKYIKDNIVMTENLERADYVAFEKKYIYPGDLIEFRYEYDFHFRTINNKYFVVDPCVIALKCEVFAKINESVRFENKLTLSEIIENGLFSEVEK